MNKIIDLHNDFLTEIGYSKYYKYLNNKNNIADGIISAVWTSEYRQDDAIRKIEESSRFIRNYNELKGKQLKLAIEDMFFISKRNLDRVLNLKPVYCSLTWNYDNFLAGGALEGGDLTPLGYEVIKELENFDIQIDTAHLNERSFMSFACVTTKPILCSHTAIWNLVDNKRNLKDYQLQMVVDSGGLVGLSFVSNFLTGQNKSSIVDVVRHIDYFVSKFGDKNLCLGTDFYGTKKMPKGIKSYKDLRLIAERLSCMGYSQTMIDNIFYKNASKFFKF